MEASEELVAGGYLRNSAILAKQLTILLPTEI
jgi:hypothetical protein